MLVILLVFHYLYHLYSSHVWQTVAAVTGGLLVLCVFVVLVVCAVKKNKSREQRVYTGNRGICTQCHYSSAE